MDMIGEGLPFVRLDDEGVKFALARFNLWLEGQLRDAFGAGMDYAVQGVTTADDLPKLDPYSLTYSATINWRGMPIEAGSDPGPGWTAFRNPASTPPLETV